jgi:hypothetical protein
MLDNTEAVDVTVWGERFVAIGRSTDGQNLILWTSTNGVEWSVAQVPADPSFSPLRLIPWESSVVVLGRGLPGSAILVCTKEFTCDRASVPDLGFTASFTTIRASATISGVIVVNAVSGIAAAAASPGSSPSATSALGLWASRDGQHWATLRSSPTVAFVASNLAVFQERLVVMVVNPDPAKAGTATVMVGELR